MRLTRRSITYDLIISLVVVVTVVSASAIGLNYLFTFRQVDQQYQEKAEEYLSYLQHALTPPMWNIDEDTIQRIAESFVQNEIIASLRILDSQGNLVFEKNASAPGTAHNYLKQPTYDIRNTAKMKSSGISECPSPQSNWRAAKNSC